MKILRTADILDVTGLSRATIWRKERAGTFPKRVRLGDNSIGYRSDEIDEWLTNLPRAAGDEVSP